LRESELPDPAVLVLISEDFFWEKVEGTLRALARRPVRPEPGSSAARLRESLAEMRPVALVADLEDEDLPVLEILAVLREEEAGGGLPVLGYCSHQRRDLQQAAEGLGAQVVPRSTFAANLVRLLMELTGGPPVAPGGASPAGEDAAG